MCNQLEEGLTISSKAQMILGVHLTPQHLKGVGAVAVHMKAFRLKLPLYERPLCLIA